MERPAHGHTELMKSISPCKILYDGHEDDVHDMETETRVTFDIECNIDVDDSKVDGNVDDEVTDEADDAVVIYDGIDDDDDDWLNQG